MASEKQHSHHDDALHPAATQTTDVEKVSTAYASSDAGHDHKAGLATAERKLLWKLDRLIVPLTALLYLRSAPQFTVARYRRSLRPHSAYLDRGNLGNARLQGLEDGPLNGSVRTRSVALVPLLMT
jgi:hypothetical protein